ncbi:DDE-type integrase/transposase/recombinase [Citreicella sp. C3M06]|nr:DDE-type integrase/transposase/recombinase [Citreicella sp. C3M06]
MLARRIPNTLEADFLNEAVHRFGPSEIMNSDQGAQFTSFAWSNRLKRIGARISMYGTGRCLDNIFIARLWRSVKDECAYLHALGDRRAGQGWRWPMDRFLQSPAAARRGLLYQIETDRQGQSVAYSTPDTVQQMGWNSELHCRRHFTPRFQCRRFQGAGGESLDVAICGKLVQFACVTGCTEVTADAVLVPASGLMLLGCRAAPQGAQGLRPPARCRRTGGAE